MKILLAESAGFCFGVNRAIDTLVKQSESSKVSTLGPIIHNRIVVDKLCNMGIDIVESVDEIKEGRSVAIRTHGVEKKIFDEIEKRSIKFLDLTCPFVKKIHNIVNEKHAEGYKIIIIGDKNHPEVIGINGWCEKNAFIVNKLSDINDEILSSDRLCVVSQTTMDRETYDKIITFLKNNCKNILIFDTICNATNERQKESAKIAKKSDIMFVIGGKNSANTNKLTDICRKYCKSTYQIENFEDIPQDIVISNKTIGITAGASTPSWIIKEVIFNMEEKTNGAMDFAKELEEFNFEETLKTLNTGDKVKGTVISVEPNGVNVDLGYKSDGFIPASEVTDDPDINITDILKPGDEIDVFVVRVNDVEGQVTLSKKKIDAIKNVEVIEKAYEDKEILTGKVIEEVNAGIIIFCKGTRVFVPKSQASDRFLKDLSSLVGKQVDFRIIEISKRRGRNKIVGSIKQVAMEQKAKLAEEFWANVEVGKIYDGIVKSLTKFGAFVDIGGIDGLVHISELSWSKIKHPSEVVKEGDSIEVYIIEFNKETGKISLGYKKPNENPWEKAKAELKLDDVIECKIVRIVPFGAFAEIYPGVDGLIHISQVANKRIEKVENELTIGQHVKAKIVELDLDKQKIGLSIRALTEKAVEAEVNEETVSQEETTEE